jgi:collagenase-like PrtC family protease
MENNKITFDVACNFDPRQLDVIEQNNENHLIKNVFGKMKYDLVGGGRPSFITNIRDFDLDYLANHIKLCHEKDLTFNYLFNPITMSNRELNVKYHNELVKFVGALVEMGVDSVTVNSPLLCTLFKQHFPKLGICTGTWAGVSSIQQIEYWEELGAEEVTLQREHTRDLKTMEAFLKHTKNTGTTLRLFCNVICVYNCAYSMNHASNYSQATRIEEATSRFLLDYNILSCSLQRFSHPAKFLAACWIRPEDLQHYDELCDKVGNYNLVFKIVDRIRTTEFFERVLKAYTTRSYDGNLLDYINFPRPGELNLDREEVMKAAQDSGYNIEDVKKYFLFLQFPQIYIDNKKLDSFFEKFVKDGNCSNRVCNDRGLLGTDGDIAGTCSYCRKWAEKVITLDQESVDAWIANAKNVLQSINTSSIFNPSNQVAV